MEDVAELAKDRTVSFIHYDEVEVADRELLVIAVHHFDHRVVSRKYNAGVIVGIVILVSEVTGGDVRQQLGKVSCSLTYKRTTVGKEQHMLNPVITLQQLSKTDCKSSLACTSGQDDECMAALLVKSFASCLDALILIIATSNLLIDIHVGDE